MTSSISEASVGSCASQLATHAHAALLSDPRGERDQGVDQPQIIERFGPELARDPSQVIEARLHRFGDLAQCLLLRSALTSGPLGQQRDGGQGLADLIVQLAGDSRPLCLLCGQGAPRTLASLGLQAIEHRVEGLRQRDRLATGASELGSTTPRGHRIHHSHQPCQAAQRLDHPPHECDVSDQHHHQSAHHDRKLIKPDRGMDRHRRKRQQQRGGHEHQRVDREDPPVQGRAPTPLLSSAS